VLLPIYSAVEDNSLDLAADRWNRLGWRHQAQHRGVSVLGRPGILLLLGVDLLGFHLPFQLLVNEGEQLMFLLPELLSQVLSFEQPAHDEGLVLTNEDTLEGALLALESLPNFVVLVVVALI